MKRITPFALLLMAFITTEGLSQDKKPLSPKETVESTIDGTKISIVYCRPSARGRKMLGEKEPYGQVWRTGANDATTVEFDKPVTIEGKALAAGKYSLFTIPSENEWTIIFNKDAKQWGAYSYKQSNDVLRVTVKPTKTDFTETFTIGVEKDNVNLKWENTAVSFAVKKG
jgi:Protein of unknown function (DUF2911)